MMKFMMVITIRMVMLLMTVMMTIINFNDDDSYDEDVGML